MFRYLSNVRLRVKTSSMGVLKKFILTLHRDKMKILHFLVLLAFFATCQGFVGNVGFMMRRERPSVHKKLVIKIH